MSEPAPNPENLPDAVPTEPDPEATSVMPAPRRQLFRRRVREDSHATDEPTAVIATPTDDTPSGTTQPGESPGPGTTAAEPADLEIPADLRAGPLERERRDLVDRREDAVYHLGGLAYELHRRGLLLGRAMRARADEVATIDDRVRSIDASLLEIERRREERRDERRARQPAAVPPEPAGACPTCETAYLEGAHFCSNCGTKLPEAVEATVAEAEAS